jgi:hypothetical protein
VEESPAPASRSVPKMLPDSRAEFPGDESNPYAPPRSEIEPERSVGDLGPIRFTIGEVVSRSWELYRLRTGECILAVVLWMVLYVVGQGLYLLVLKLASRTVPALVFLAVLTVLVFHLWITVGLSRVLLDIVRGRAANLGGIFAGGRHLLRMFFATLLFFLVLMGAGILVMIPSIFVASLVRRSPAVEQALTLVGVLSGYAVLVIVALRMAMYGCLIIERDCGALESLGLSYRMTKDRVGRLFVIALLAWVVSVCGLLACGVGILFTAPLSWLLLIVSYVALADNPDPDPEAWEEELPPVEIEPL